MNGIDISNWQAGLNLAAVKPEFCICKLGEGTTWKDPSFSNFYDQCKRNDIPVGAYVFSHSTSADGGSAEADAALSALAGRKLDLPLYLDIEGSILSAGNAALMASALAFAETVRAAGYRPGVYASASPLQTVLDVPQLRANGISIWCAAYNSVGPGIDCDIWQYSDTGRLSGYSGAVDMDLMINDIIEKAPDTVMITAETAEKRWNAEMATLCRGFYGTQVELLQLALGIEPDGIFGENTERAVRTFQRACGISPDGIAGPQTFSKLKETMK